VARGVGHDELRILVQDLERLERGERVAGRLRRVGLAAPARAAPAVSASAVAMAVAAHAHSTGRSSRRPSATGTARGSGVLHHFFRIVARVLVELPGPGQIGQRDGLQGHGAGQRHLKSQQDRLERPRVRPHSAHLHPFERSGRAPGYTSRGYNRRP
jgi:hypothetical protein